MSKNATMAFTCIKGSCLCKRFDMMSEPHDVNTRNKSNRHLYDLSSCPLGRQHTILEVTVFSCPFAQYLARVMFCRALDLASVKMSVPFPGDDYFEVP